MPSIFEPATGLYTGTWVWGYVTGPVPPVGPRETFTGPVVVTTRGIPAQFRFVNNLPTGNTTNVLAWYAATDQTLHWADPLNGGMNHCVHQAMMNPGVPPVGYCAEHYGGSIPAAVHLHGGEVPPLIDGGPDSWFTSDGMHHGPGYYTRPGVAAAPNEAVYRYPNGQEAAPIWFHDHALGITRLNVYAGIAGAYLVTDPNLQLPTGLHPLGLQQGASGAVEFIVPLVIQDRMFDTNGQLYYPNEGDNPEHPYWIPEFLGDTILVNGKVWPYLEVEPRRYRFLLLNGSNSRAYELFLNDQHSSQPGPVIWQIGTDGGYLDSPVAIGSMSRQKLVLMPGERADVIIDFAGFAGRTLLIRNSARAPYPKGEPPRGNTTGRILQLRVQHDPVPDASYNPALGTPIRSGSQRLVRLVNPATGTLAPGVVPDQVRQLTLNEVMGDEGPLAALLNNTIWSGTDRPDFMPITTGGQTIYYSELPAEGETEVWEIVNLTADAHPIHTHLTQFQVLNRQRFNVHRYTRDYMRAFPPQLVTMDGFGPPLDYNTGNPRALGGNPDITPYLTGPATAPNANEAGWKDTVTMLPGQVTRIVVRYAPTDTPVSVPDGTYPFNPGLGGFVWHCHILEHEDNEMMRPLFVYPTPGAIRTFIQGIDY
jgi:FtsP/CotA-like multicopper oxidase with cupredoxin domain